MTTPAQPGEGGLGLLLTGGRGHPLGYEGWGSWRERPSRLTDRAAPTKPHGLSVPRSGILESVDFPLGPLCKVPHPALLTLE